MSRQITRLPSRCARNFFDNLLRWAFSITKIRSAQCSNSGDTGVLASLPSPADCVSMPGQLANTCSPVGLRRRFWVQMKRTLRGMEEIPVDAVDQLPGSGEVAR